MRVHRVALALFALLSAAPFGATAADPRCRNYSWSLGERIDLFDAGYMPVYESGQWLPKEGVFALKLKPAADVVYRVPPERGMDSGFGGVITIESLPAGRYQVVLTEEAWLDAVENYKRLPVLETVRARNCPGVRQTVEFDFSGEPLVLQMGGVGADHVSIAVVRVWNFPEK